VIGEGRKKILIDTGEGIEGYIEDLAQVAEELQCVLITHHHRDHTGGIADVLRRFGSVPVFKYKTSTDGPEYQHIQEGDVIEFENFYLQVIQTPGHCDDHISFWFPQEKAIFTGDIVLGTGSTLLSNYSEYLKSMEKLKGFQPEVLYTPHGQPKVPAGKIQADLMHRKDRENQILQVLDCRMTAIEIMKRVYGEIDQRLVTPALGNTNLYLNHLRQAGVLAENEGKWFKI
jgi:glyoxylase-like metal-dependent hydrolase (beta-lactamase superfamily II)